jgi:hypothetical protein
MKQVLMIITFIFVFNSYADDSGTITSSLENKTEENKGGDGQTKGKISWKLPTFLSWPKISMPTEPKLQEVQPEEVKPFTTSDSKLKIAEKISEDNNFIMFRIARNDRPEEEEVVIYPLKNGEIRTQLYFRKGAGRYRVNVFANKTNEKYTSESRYSFVKGFDVDNSDTRDMEFLLPSTEVQSDNKVLVKLAKNITKVSVDETDAIKKIHDTIVADLDFDTASYKDRSFINKPYDAMTVSKTKIAVCLGYSNYLAALARIIGIRARVVFGKALYPTGWEDHAWNEVLVDGEWKIIDATWDDNPLKYTYFFPNPKEFSKTHRKETDNPGL